MQLDSSKITSISSVILSKCQNNVLKTIKTFFVGFKTFSLQTYEADQQATKPRWNYLGYLEQERQWGPALGLVGGKPTIATGTVFLRKVLEFLTCLCTAD